ALASADWHTAGGELWGTGTGDCGGTGDAFCAGTRYGAGGPLSPLCWRAGPATERASGGHCPLHPRPDTPANPARDPRAYRAGTAGAHGLGAGTDRHQRVCRPRCRTYLQPSAGAVPASRRDTPPLPGMIWPLDIPFSAGGVADGASRGGGTLPPRQQAASPGALHEGP